MRKLLLSACAAGALLYAGHAEANLLTITGFDGTTTVSNTGSSPINYGPTPVGTFSAQGTATGTPPLGQGNLFSNTTVIQTTGAGTFTLWITENGLTGPLGKVDFLSSLTSNLLFGGVDSVTQTTSIQFNDSTPGPLVGLGTTLDSKTFTASNSTDMTHTLETIGGTYSLTEQYIVHATGTGGANLTIDLTGTAVPEPASLALFGTALVGLAGVIRRRRRQGDQS